jgi:hypothetical protein
LELEQTPSFRGDAKHRTRNLEIPGLALTRHPGMTASRLTRNDRLEPSCLGGLKNESEHTRTRVTSPPAGDGIPGEISRAENSTIASPVATSPVWLRTMTSINAQREFAVTCFGLTMPVGWMVSPGRTGLTHLVSRRR